MAHDGELGCALGVALGGEAGSERMSGEQSIEPYSARAAFKADYGPECAAETLDELDEFIKIGKVPWESEVE